MLNRKVDIIIQIILIVLFFELLSYFFPISSNFTLTDYFSNLIDAIIFSYGVFYCYLRIRNAIFRHKLNKYCNQKNCDTAINLLDRAIIGQPKIPWLRMQRAILLGTSGRYDSFREEFEMIYNHKSFCKKKNIVYYYSLLAISDGIDILNDVSAKIKLNSEVNEKPIEKYLKQPYLHINKAIHAYQDNNMKNAVYYASLLYYESSDFLRLFSSFILMNAYEALNQMEKSNIYKNIYLSSPLKEMAIK